MNPERPKGEPTAPFRVRSAQEINEGCSTTADGCYGCVGMIAILLCCIGFLGLRVAFRGATETSNGGVEIHQRPDNSTDVKDHLLKPNAGPPHQAASTFIRVIGGLFGLAATALGAILIFIFCAYCSGWKGPPELDKGDTPRRIKKNRDGF